jgi:hypothetical protein
MSDASTKQFIESTGSQLSAAMVLRIGPQVGV